MHLHAGEALFMCCLMRRQKEILYSSSGPSRRPRIVPRMARSRTLLRSICALAYRADICASHEYRSCFGQSTHPCSAACQRGPDAESCRGKHLELYGTCQYVVCCESFERFMGLAGPGRCIVCVLKIRAVASSGANPAASSSYLYCSAACLRLQCDAAMQWL